MTTQIIIIAGSITASKIAVGSITASRFNPRDTVMRWFRDNQPDALKTMFGSDQDRVMFLLALDFSTPSDEHFAAIEKAYHGVRAECFKPVCQ